MGWPQIKQKARDDVHRTFVWPALFLTTPTPVEIGVRVHYRVKQFGDLDREGFATVVEDVNFIILDSRECSAVEGDLISVPLLNRTFKLAVQHPSEDLIYNKWEVTEAGA
jgi:hypothetical protein